MKEMEKKDKVQEILEKLEQGIQDLFESEKYKEYLTVMSRFHNYSFNNSLLIAMQNPDATYVAGFTAWQKNFDRHVLKGEQGIRILAPAPYKIKQLAERIDPITQAVMRDKNGNVLHEEIEKIIPAYKVTTVFDIVQTEGEELPQIVEQLSGEVDEYEKFFETLRQVSPVPIEFAEIQAGANGFYHLAEKKIVIREGMSQMQNLKTAIHEISHAILHDRDTGKEKDNLPDRRTKEVEAESVAYTVCQHFGLDTSDYSFGYVAGWSAGKELAELKRSMNTIRSTAADIINGIETRFKDRDMVEEKQQEKVVQADLAENTSKQNKDVVKQYHRSR